MREQIIKKLWAPDPFKDGIGMFVAGGGILWTPVLVRGNLIKTPERLARSGPGFDEVVGWLASRQPPINKRVMEARMMPNPLRVDITERLKRGLSESTQDIVDVLWDCRFLIRFNLSKMPPHLREDLANPASQNRMFILPNTRWYWPKAVFQQGEKETMLHSDVADSQHPLLFMKAENDVQQSRAYWRRYDKPVVSDWIHMEWIRPLTAI